MNAETYRIGDTMLETDEVYFAIAMFPVRKKRQDKVKCRCLGVGIVVGQRYVWDLIQNVLACAVNRHYYSRES